jgi:hypothetical protein
VRSGKIVTAAGVSAGLDLALWLAGEVAGRERAEAIQLVIEYDPQPPFDAGHISKASEKVQRLARSLFKERMPAEQTDSVHVDAAAQAALLAIDRAGPGNIFNLTEPNPLVTTAKARDELGWQASFRLPR